MDYRYIKDFQKLGLGLFVHFGLYSVIGKGEWYCCNLKGEQKASYERTIEKFVVKKEWAKDLVDTAKKAGAKYINVTTRHHDGFSLYDTCGLSDFDAPRSASGRDLISEFVSACNEADIKPFFYHTLLDWHNPDYVDNFPKYIDYLVSSVELLCKNYGQIGGFWFDGFWDKPDADWQFDRLYGVIRKYQPTAMIINNTGLNALGKVSHKEIDSVTFERGKPSFVDCSDKPRAGEMCEGLTDHWGYAERDLCVKSFRQIIETYVDCRSCGCNLLLNTGLSGDGTIPKAEEATLENVGKWIGYTGGFLYDAVPAEFDADCAAVLKNGADYYLCIKDVPMEANVNVTRHDNDKRVVKLNTERKIVSAEWLDNAKPVEFKGNSIVTAPFDYGTSLGCRVAKIRFEKPSVAFLGDSITYGGCASSPEKAYTRRVEKMLDCIADVYGVIGTRIAKQTTPSAVSNFDEDFLSRAEKMKDADFVFVFGGTNDYGHGDADIGDLNSTDDYTFCGAVRNLATYLIKRYGKNNVCFILPLRRYDEDNPKGEDGTQPKARPSLKIYVEKEIAVLKNLGVKYLDLRDKFPAPTSKNPSEYYADGLHPNDKGHELIAEEIVKFLVGNKSAQFYQK